jgi:hypothetical protein
MHIRSYAYTYRNRQRLIFLGERERETLAPPLERTVRVNLGVIEVLVRYLFLSAYTSSWYCTHACGRRISRCVRSYHS